MATAKTTKRINIGGTKSKTHNKAVESSDQHIATVENPTKPQTEEIAIMYADISKRLDEISIVMKQILDKLPSRLNLDFLNK